jgi:hypothetical protein
MSKEPSPVDWPNRGRPPEDPDGLLRALFRAEMPDPWPGFRRPGGSAPVVTANGRAPATESAPPRTWPALRPALRRRLALAAAASALLAGTLLLSGQFRTSAPDAPTGPGIANPRLPRDVIIQESLIQDGEQPTKVMIDIYAP